MAMKKAKPKSVEEENPVELQVEPAEEPAPRKRPAKKEVIEPTQCCKEANMVEEVKEVKQEEVLGESEEDVIYTEEECREKASIMGCCASRAEQAAQMTAKVIYKTFFGMAFGVVYSSLFVGEMFKADNPVFNGLRDGASAAKEAVHHRREAKTCCPEEDEALEAATTA